METATKAVKVKDLSAGDDLGNCVILSSSYLGNYCGQKNRQMVTVRYSNGTESTRVWGRETTVKIKAQTGGVA